MTLLLQSNWISAPASIVSEKMSQMSCLMISYQRCRSCLTKVGTSIDFQMSVSGDNRLKGSISLVFKDNIQLVRV